MFWNREAFPDREPIQNYWQAASLIRIYGGWIDRLATLAWKMKTKQRWESFQMPDERTLAKGEYLFREGESAVYGYIVKTGRVAIVKSGLDGERVLGELGPGALLGEMALIDGNPRSASARAEEESVVTEISSKVFNDYIRTNPNAARRIMETLAGQVRTANNELAHVISNAEPGISVTDTELVDKEHSDNEIEDT
ncbi:uncharacterized protein METZ01_LOCUS426817, partial [marine metagenome]